MDNPEYHQLNLSLSGSLFGGIYKRSKNVKNHKNDARSATSLFDLFDVTKPASRRKVTRGNGLKFDKELTNKCADRLREMGLYS